MTKTIIIITFLYIIKIILPKINKKIKLKKNKKITEHLLTKYLKGVNKNHCEYYLEDFTPNYIILSLTTIIQTYIYFTETNLSLEINILFVLLILAMELYNYVEYSLEGMGEYNQFLIQKIKEKYKEFESREEIYYLFLNRQFIILNQYGERTAIKVKNVKQLDLVIKKVAITELRILKEKGLEQETTKEKINKIKEKWITKNGVY